MEFDLLPESLNVIKSLVISKAKIFLNFTVSVPGNGAVERKLGGVKLLQKEQLNKRHIKT